MLHGAFAFQVLLFVLASVFAVILLVGYRTRLATGMSWLFLTSLNLRNDYILDGGDWILHLLLFWSLFLPLEARFSIDMRRRSMKSHPQSTMLSIASAAIMLQLGFVYFFASLLKSYGAEWRDGTAVYYALHHEFWVRPFRVWLRGFPELVKGLNYAVLGLEFLGPLLLFAPLWTVPIRTLTIVAFLGLQLGMSMSIELSLFPWVSSVALIPFIPRTFWDQVQRAGWQHGGNGSRAARSRTATADERHRHHQGGAIPVESMSSSGTRTIARIREGIALIALLYVFFSNVESLRIISVVPRPIQSLGYGFGLTQGWGMYAPSPGDDNRAPA